MKRLLSYCAGALAGALPLLVAAPVTAAPVGAVLAPGNFIHVVAHIDKTIAFYHGVLGLNQLTFGNAPPAAPKFAPNGPVAQLYAVPADTAVAVTVFRLPVMGVGLEFAQFRGVAQKSSRPQPQDPGASVVVLTVRDLEPILQRAHAAHVPIVSTGGVPVATGDDAARRRIVVLSDPDGYYVELIERAAPAGSTDSGAGAAGGDSVQQASLMLSIADTDQNAHFYRDLLGLPLQIDADFSAEASLSRAFGVRSARLRHSVVTFPGVGFSYDFVEWKGLPRRPSHAGVHDHGAGVLRLVVSDVEGFVANLKDQGVAVDSTGQGTVQINAMFRASILSDPNGLYIEPVPHFVPRRPAAPAPQAAPSRPAP